MSKPADGHVTARDGAKLFYRECGAGRPLVLLHGIFGGSEMRLEHGFARLLAASPSVVVRLVPTSLSSGVGSCLVARRRSLR